MKSAQKLLNDLGLTPASRTRVAAAVDQAEDEFAAFMSRRAGRDEKTEG
jgi:phage terminase small subunit